MESSIDANDVSRISAGTVFKGEVTSTGDIRIDGDFDGKVVTNGRLVIGENSSVKGDFICPNIDLSGVMETGVLVVKDTLSLKSGSVIKEGDLSFKRLQVELDAKLSGTCHVLEDGEFEKKAGIKETPAEKSSKKEVTNPENEETE